tara:strand:- start:416 stop:697 length:282 start_codon:yes stop_codon:yes gene_type:complete
MTKKYIEIIYISSNNKIIKNYIEHNEKLCLKELVDLMIKNSIFSKIFFANKTFGCFGKKINFSYVIKKNDRIEILDNLKMSPNNKRKFNFKKN